MHRRDFLRAGIGLGVAGLLPSSAFACDKKKFKANKFVQKFPEAEEIPGIAKVERIQTKNANKVFVLFRQWHEDWTLTPEEIAKVEACQTELLHAMDHMRQNERFKFSSILNEGTRRGEERAWLDHYREFARLRFTAFTAPGVDTIVIPDDRMLASMLRNEALLQKRVQNMSSLARIGAVEILALRGHLQLCGAEDPVIRQRMENARTDAQLAYWQFDPRENAVLRYAAEDTGDVQYAVYGAAHEWQSNLEKWNADEANAVKFAAVVLHTKTAAKEDAKHALQKD